MTHIPGRRPLMTVMGVVCVGLLAFLLRMYHLGEQELWLDEVFSVHFAMLHQHFADVLRLENSPPLYYLLLRSWISIAGTGEAEVRFLSALAGTLGVLAVMWAGRQIFNSEVGLWTGGFAAVAPIHVYYSQEARVYALLTFELALSYGLLWRAMRVNTRISWVLVAAAALSALYSHYFAVMALLPALLIVAMWPSDAQTPLRRRRFLIATALCVMLYLPWLIWAFVLNSHADTISNNYAMSYANWRALPSASVIPLTFELLGLGSQAELLPTNLKQFASLIFPDSMRIAGLALLLGLFLWVLAPWQDRNLAFPWLFRRKIWVTSLMVVPLMILWLASLYRPIYVVGRHDIVAFPGYALLVGLAFAKLRAVKRIGVVLAILAGVGLVIPIGTKLLLYYRAPMVPAGNGIAATVDRYVGNDDIVVFDEVNGRLALGYYLPRLEYDWESETCRNTRRHRHFICRIFPFEAEQTFLYAGERVINSPELLLAEASAIARQIEASNGRLWMSLHWSVFSDGILVTVPPADFLVRELVRVGFQPQAVAMEGIAPIFLFQRAVNVR